jgi:hypothetical protein
MIMLTSDGDTDEDSVIVLFHGYDPMYDNSTIQSWYVISANPATLTIPAKIHCEHTGMSPVVDFCFLPSSPLTEHSIWNAMTIALCTRNGSLYALSPIVFHNTVFPYQMIKDGYNLLEKTVIKSEHSVSKGAECRRAKAALQYLNDVFGDSISNKHSSKDAYAKSDVIHPSGRMSAVVWPVGVQTLFVSQQGNGLDGVQCMEIIPASPIVSPVMNGGVSILMLANDSTIDFVLVPSGSNILPRFAFEAVEDRQHLDDLVVDSVVVMERISLGKDENDSDHSDSTDGIWKSIILQPDPVDRSIVHRVSSEGVATVSTNVFSMVEKSVGALLHDPTQPYSHTADETETDVWSSISMKKNNGKKLAGIVVSGDAQFGHVLVAALDDSK